MRKQPARSTWTPHDATCARCGQTYWMPKATRRYCDTCRNLKPQNTRRKQLDLLGSRRRSVTALVRQREPNCHLCDLPIDLTLDRQRHPLASCIDELTPRHHGGDARDPANCRHAHRVCNGSRGTQAITPEVRARCRELALHHLATTKPQVNAW